MQHTSNTETWIPSESLCFRRELRLNGAGKMHCLLVLYIVSRLQTPLRKSHLTEAFPVSTLLQKVFTLPAYTSTRPCACINGALLFTLCVVELRFYIAFYLYFTLEINNLFLIFLLFYFWLQILTFKEYNA